MDHNAVTPVRLEPAAPQSRVKHCTTEPLRSQMQTLMYQKSDRRIYQYTKGYGL